MRVAYVCYWNLDVENGVTYKIRDQAGRWRAAGHEVELFALPPSALPERLRGSRRLAAAVTRFRPDVVYLRYDLYLPPIWRLARRACTVVEVNTDDRAESHLRIRRAQAAGAFNRVNRRFVLGGADGFVAVTEELARGIADLGKPTEVVANGVELDEISPAPPAASGGPPTLVFLGSARQAWHGVDKISRLAERLPDARFEVVGYRSELVDFPVPSNMIVHPRLTRREYEPILARAHVALGTLALHRKRMEEACPLKVREYLAYGLPTVIAYRDTDFADADEWYLLRLPNVEENVEEHVDEIAAFVSRVRDRRVPRADVEGRISVAAKEDRRISFLERLAG